MNKEDNLTIRITAKGEIEGAKMFFPVLQWLIIFRKDNPNATLENAVDEIYRVLQRTIRRGKANEDGTITLQEFDEIKEMEPLIEHIYKNRDKKYEK
jgi:hypothetical protein